MSPHTRLFDIDRRSMMKALGALGVASAVSGGSASASSSSVADRHGPYRNNRFLVEIEGIATAGFSAIEMPDAIVQDVEYREGTDPHTDRILKGSNDYDSLVLERGVTDDSIALFEWFKLAEQGRLDEARRNIAVVILDTTGQSGP